MGKRLSETQTYTGEIVSFTDMVGGSPITSLTVPFSPIQDLHGYDHPWPAGGGANLFGETLRSGYMPLNLPAGTYTATAERIDTTTTAYFYIARAVSGTTDYETIGRVLAGRNENPVTFTVEAGYDYCAWCNSTYTNIQHVQIEQGSTATDWTPYENLCPISGWTGLNVYVGATTEQADATTYAVDWTAQAGTVYGGTDDVVGGVLTDEWAEIPSYNGETITEPWLSSMDEYTPGATPTTGAQVVYKLAIPISYQLTAQDIETLVGENNIWADTGEDITVQVSMPLTGFQGWLVKVGNEGSGVEIPIKWIRAETYSATPDQRMEWSAERDVTGYLWRQTVQNQPPKIEFNTRLLTNNEISALNAIFKAAFTNEQQRKLPVQFYDMEKDEYWIWDCYMPDTKYTIRNVDVANKIVNYEETRYAFIGY